MATWKKVIVSGSTANLANLQVDGLTSGQVVIGGGTGSNLTTTPINGTGNILATTGATGASISGSFSGSFTGAITTFLANVSKPNFVAYDTVTGTFSYANTGSFTATSASYATTASYALSSSYALSASNAATASSTVGTLSAIGSGGISLSNNFNGSTGSAVSLTGYAGFTSNGILKWNGSSLANSSITDDGTTISTAASISAGGANSSLSGSFSGNLTGTASYASNADSLDGLDSTAFLKNSQTSSMLAPYILASQTSSMSVLSASYASSASYSLTAVSSSFASTVGSISSNVTNNTDNYILTATGGGNINGESNLTFNGSLLTVAGNATITGDLTVAGTASFTNTDNLNIRDKFILINSGSSTLADSGWITQYNAAGSGSAFYLEATSAGTYGRFAVAYDAIGTATSIAADEFVVTAKVNQSAPGAATPTWGGSGTNGQGNMWLTSTGDIYIWA